MYFKLMFVIHHYVYVG